MNVKCAHACSQFTSYHSFPSLICVSFTIFKLLCKDNVVGRCAVALCRIREFSFNYSILSYG